MEKQPDPVDARFWGAAIIIAPLLQFLSTFFWKSGEYGVQGGTLLIFSCLVWIIALTGLFDMLKEKMPYYSRIGLLIAIYGYVAGINFGFIGFYSEVFNISHEKYMASVSGYSIYFNLLLFWAGPLGPLSLLVLGIQLLRTRSIPLWPGTLFCAGAISFPLSRIPRIPWIAHLSDILILIPLLYIGWIFINGQKLSAAVPVNKRVVS